MLVMIVAAIVIQSCGRQKPEDNYVPNENALFREVPQSQSGITFENTLEYTEQLNTYTFKNFYNGGGVGIGDLNNDGLPEIFFSGNMVSSRLYLNKGGLVFEDITEKAGLFNDKTWTTGVSMVDINADGLLDIYVCKSGPPGGDFRYNQMFVNNGDMTFTDKAKEYGLAFEGLSTHAAFFDYDKDGDLDCYLLNNSFRPIGAYDFRKDWRKSQDPGGNKLLRNDDNKFLDVSSEAGIFTSEIGFGLGVSIADVDGDGWQDIFVSNDFFERDYLYLNNKDGKFREALEECMREISLGSMGADIADINNDGLPEVFVTEMLPESDERLKTTSQFDSWDRYRVAVDNGYYHQFSRNALQLNNGDGHFSEIGRYAGVHATDWSWGALILDMNNDGWKDIFVANGIYKDLLNQDYVNFIANPETVRELMRKEKDVISRLIDSIPTNRIPNYAFINEGNSLRFRDVSVDWGFGRPTNSNGSAYGDLDGDGDLDLVLNNINMPSAMYENRTNEKHPENRYLSVKLVGDGMNRSGIGAKVTVRAGGKSFTQELSPMRGFMSSVDYKLLFGLGDGSSIDTLKVEWWDGRISIMKDVQAAKSIEVRQSEAVKYLLKPNTPKQSTIFNTKPTIAVDFVHRESEFIDFNRDRLLYNMVSNEGPCLCKGDVNGDGLDDFYVGGAKGQTGELYIQSQGGFKKSLQPAFEDARNSEDVDCAIFDANGDKMMDLYVVSGSNEHSMSSSALADRLYLMKGGKMVKSDQILPANLFESKSSVTVSDYDQDGDNDLFVGVRQVVGIYGLPANGYILSNDGKGNFTNVSNEIAFPLKELGMITDAKWADVSGDGKPDLVVCGEWMPLKVFVNRDGKFVDESEKLGLAKTEGWYHSLSVADVNGDSRLDIVAGNHGLNSRFKAAGNDPILLYVNDFDKNGTPEHIMTRMVGDKQLPYVLRNDLVGQIPSLRKKYLHFKNYKDQSVEQIFTPEQMVGAYQLTARDLETSLYINTENGFEKRALPAQAQFTPIYSIVTEDFDGDGKADIFMGGNLYRAKPEMGIYDASYGLLLKGDGEGNFETIDSRKSGLLVTGEVRAAVTMKVKGKKVLAVGRNNLGIQFISY